MFTHTWNNILEQLDNVSRTGENQVRARCPNCSSGSFYTKVGDQKILLYCHSGCKLSELVGSLGIELKDLFVRNDDFKRTKNWAYWKERGEIDLEIVFIYEQWMKLGKNISPKDKSQYVQAKQRLEQYQK